MTIFDVKINDRSINVDYDDLQSITAEPDVRASHRCKGCGRDLTEYPGDSDGPNRFTAECSENVDEDSDTFGPHVAEPMPLSWLNWAGIQVDESHDDVTVLLSVDDPRTAFSFSIHRIDDPDHENHGKLVLIMPYAKESGSHAPLTQIAGGGYVIEVN